MCKIADECDNSMRDNEITHDKNKSLYKQACSEIITTSIQKKVG